MNPNPMMMKRVLLLAFALLLLPQLAHAWWNKDWANRAKITLDTSATGVDLKEGIDNMPVLLRLHSGNFNFVGAKEDGADLRFIAADDKTPLKYHIEKFDALAEIALVWVQVPKLLAATKDQQIWVYYGNDKVAAANDPHGSYDVNQVAVLHFAEKDGQPQDATAYATNVTQFTGSRVPGGMIGQGAAFDGKTVMSAPASPALKLTPASGFTFSAWVKMADLQEAQLLAMQDGKAAIIIGVKGAKLYARVENGAEPVEADGGALQPGTWQHVAVSVGQEVVIYLNGQWVGKSAGVAPAMQGGFVIGKGYKGEIDEVELANVTRSQDWIRMAALGQGVDAKLAVVDKEESSEGEGNSSYFGVILKSVTLDGWVVIAVLIVMMVISWMVMVSKALVIGKTAKGNQEFLVDFHKLKAGDTANLDVDQEESDEQGSELMSALFGKHDHYQHASLYRLYHAAIQEVKHRITERNVEKTLSPQALGAIKASLDGTLVRENQKLNNLMVLLTIAISGGPFLGLLGTVVGVMITFAAIAATGDVNVAAIAPGIAAALVATVAGLAVAIPALFGYNYLGSRIKTITADMHVFVDELIGRIAEAYSR
jgi:biopolymer transport protein ExbB